MILAAAAVFAAVLGNSVPAGFEYRELVDGSVAVKYTGNDANVVILASIKGKPVTAIDTRAFRDCKP